MTARSLCVLAYDQVSLLFVDSTIEDDCLRKDRKGQLKVIIKSF